MLNLFLFHIFYCIRQVLWMLFHIAHTKQIICKEREEIEKQMKGLFGGGVPLPDFLFYEYKELENFMLTQEKGGVRTTLDHQEIRAAKSRTPAEVTIMKALNYLENDRFAQIISMWAKHLDMVINHAIWLEDCKKNRHRRSIYNARFTIQQIEKTPEYNPHILKRRPSHFQQEHIIEHIGLSDFNLRRMRRAASFSYANKMKCTPEGGRLDSKGRISLCETCAGYIDFGPDV
jgi:hypothetical protein